MQHPEAFPYKNESERREAEYANDLIEKSRQAIRNSNVAGTRWVVEFPQDLGRMKMTKDEKREFLNIGEKESTTERTIERIND